MIVENDWLECLPHVPFQIVGKHAQQDVGPHTICETMMDRPDFEVDRLEAAERPFGI